MITKLITTYWHCYSCKQVHSRRFAPEDVRDFMVADCPRCCGRRRKLVRLRPQAFSSAPSGPINGERRVERC
jgi:hypothetical protein